MCDHASTAQLQRISWLAFPLYGGDLARWEKYQPEVAAQVSQGQAKALPELTPYDADHLVARMEKALAEKHSTPTTKGLSTMCDHNGRHYDHIEAIDHPDYEVYRCECGALVNLRDPRNENIGMYDAVSEVGQDAAHAMTADEIGRMVGRIGNWGLVE